MLDNGLIRAEFDYMTGALVSLRDVRTGVEYVKEGGKGTFVLIDTESRTSNAWLIGKYQKITPLTDIRYFSEGKGNLRQSVSYELCVKGSRIKAHIDSFNTSKVFVIWQRL